VAFGGQTAIKLAAPLDKAGVKILGTSAEGIDLAEDREKFDKLLEQFGIRRPAGALAMTLDEAVEGAAKLGYPVLLRPSYVIGGQNMTIAKCEADTRAYMGKILAGGIENPVLVDKYMPGIELEVDVISDGENVLIPGIMEHIERAGVHSGDSIAVYPPYNLTDNFLKKICDCSEKLGLALGTKGLVNIQYLIHGGELYVIEVNPRASRTVPYISKVTGVPMTDLAADVMLGGKLTELGWGTGLARTVPYCAVKVPVFSFEKLNDANSILGPEMKSTGEVLGIGKNLGEALCKGLASANLSLPAHPSGVGVLISVEESSYGEIVPAARTFSDAGMVLYATPGTAEHLGKAGISAKCVGGSGNDEIISLMEQGAIGYIIYTGAVKDGTLGDYIRLHKRAMQLGIPCLTSVDTAGALADASRSRYTQANVELVDICHLRRRKQRIPFTKMQTCGNDYIFIENFDNKLTCPESLCVDLCSPHYGIGADGIVLIEDSDVADVKMRSFNKDGSEGRMAGNNIRCVAKLLYDEGLISTERMTVETASGVHSLKLMLRDGKVNSVSVDMGIAAIDTSVTELTLPGSGEQFSVTLVDTGNPHCVIFSDSPETLDIGRIGPAIEHHELFPGRTNVEFVRVTDRTEIRVKVWERGNGETLASGTSAAAACAACVAKGLVDTGRDIKVKLPGGDVSVRVEADGQVTLTGSAVLVFKGEFQF